METMSNNDWQSALGALLDSGSLPQGEETPQTADAPRKPAADKLTVSMEKKGRNGKTATIISGFTAPQPELERIAARLKAALGTGGSARGGEILIQGDRRNDAIRLLREMGFKL